MISGLSSKDKFELCESAVHYSCQLRRYSSKLTDGNSVSQFCLSGDSQFCVEVSVLDYNSSHPSKLHEYTESYCVNDFINDQAGIEVRYDSAQIEEALTASRQACRELAK